MPKRYAELQCKTNFSFLHGASHPDELINRAAELGYQALAITDRATLAGIVRAHVAAKHTGLKLIIGAEIEPVDAPPVILYAPDFAAYRRLARLITTGRRAAPKGECRLTLDDVAAQAQGLVAAVKMVDTLRESAEEAASEKKDYQMRRASVASVVSDQNASLATLARRPWYPSRSPSPLSVYRDIFSRRCYLAAALHRGPDDDALLERLIALSSQTRLPLLAVNDVHYHHPSRQPLHEVLTAVREGVAVKDLGFLRFPNAERYLKSPAQMWEVFRDYPRAITNILELIEQFNFSLEELRYEYPEELSLPGQTPLDYLTELTWQGAGRMYLAGIPRQGPQPLNKELDLHRRARYEAFLTAWDLVVFASPAASCASAARRRTRRSVSARRHLRRPRPSRRPRTLHQPRAQREAGHRCRFRARARGGDAVHLPEARRDWPASPPRSSPIACVRPSATSAALGLSLDCVDRLAKTMSHYHDEANFADACATPA
ncbi:MAG: PHP domain-containing protein [Gemmataceae bacterium]